MMDFYGFMVTLTVMAVMLVVGFMFGRHPRYKSYKAVGLENYEKVGAAECPRYFGEWYERENSQGSQR